MSGLNRRQQRERGREGGGYEEEEEGACWRSQSRQTGVLACMRGRRAGKLTGPVRVPQVTCLYERGPRTTDHSDEGVIIKLSAS